MVTATSADGGTLLPLLVQLLLWCVVVFNFPIFLYSLSQTGLTNFAAIYECKLSSN